MLTYGQLVSGISSLLESARRTIVRSNNNVLTATYWEVGRRVVEYEQHGKSRAEYGKKLLFRLSKDLSKQHGRGFSDRNLRQMRTFYLGWEIWQMPSAKLEARVKLPIAGDKSQSGKWQISQPISFPLSWSQYVRLMSVDNPRARAFYESEAVRGGWSVPELDRQINTRFFERAIQSKYPQSLLARTSKAQDKNVLPVEMEIRDPYLLEFLNLKDEYSETQMEDALVHHLEWFLLEMGTGFTFIARQKRIRIGTSWYRIDLLLYHRGLRCLVIVDLKTGTFNHADAGQMNLYLNYAREHLMMDGEADPIGVILCSEKDDAVVKYATGGIHAKVFASKYLINLPNEETLRREILATQRAFQARLKKETT